MIDRADGWLVVEVHIRDLGQVRVFAERWGRQEHSTRYDLIEQHVLPELRGAQVLDDLAAV